MTSDQLFELAVQYSAMARAAQIKRLTLPPDSQEAESLGQARLSLSNASSQLLAPALNAALDQLAPHYDAMLSVVRDLNHEVSQELKVAKILQFANAALAIAAAVQLGNAGGVLTALGEARDLLK